MNFWKFVFTLLSLHFQSISGQSEVYEEDPRPGEYVIVVDGGSSGTRLHVFQFNRTDLYPKLISNSLFKLKRPFSEFTKDRENWSLLRIMINNLTSQALAIIPEELVNKTHIYVQVTAGVRQLEYRIGQRILNHIRNVLFRSKLFFQAQFVDILSAKDEGLFTWISVNYLLDRLQPENIGSRKTVGIMDLGGGSTQISFATTHPDLMTKTVNLQLFGLEYNVYAAGYDGMGINAIRLKYFGDENCVDKTCDNETKFSSCLPLNVTRKFNMEDRKFKISGKFSQDRFNHCSEVGKRLIKKVERIRKYFKEMEFVGISTFYHVAKGAGAIEGQDENGLNSTRTIEFLYRAYIICADPNFHYKGGAFDHLLCLDTSYISALLHNAYGMDYSDKISVALKINGTHISWALGYALSKL